MRYYADGDSHTARAKRLDVNHFTKFLLHYCGASKPQKLKVDDWNASATAAFIEDKLRQGESPATVARRLATLKHMGRTLAELTPGFVNPAREVKTPKIPTQRPQGLNKNEISGIRNKGEARIEERDSFVRHRNKFLVEFLLDTGLRAEEVRLLRMSQFDDKCEWIKNVRTKGKRYRNVYITSAIRSAFQKYLELRALELARFFPKLSKTIDKTLPLFISNYRCNPERPDSFLMGSKSIWRAVHELSGSNELHPHLLRHSYALELLDSSNDIRLVAQALGHGDVRITMRYTERSTEQIAAALEKSRNSND